MTNSNKQGLLKVICGICAAVMVFACAAGCAKNEEKAEEKKAETAVTEQKKEDKADTAKTETKEEKKDDKAAEKKDEKADAAKKEEKTDKATEKKEETKPAVNAPEVAKPQETNKVGTTVVIDSAKKEEAEVMTLPEDAKIVEADPDTLKVFEPDTLKNEAKIVASAKKALKVPEKSGISYTVSPPMPSSDGKDVVYVTFTENGKPVASAECDAATGEVIGGKMMYKG